MFHAFVNLREIFVELCVTNSFNQPDPDCNST